MESENVAQIKRPTKERAPVTRSDISFPYADLESSFEVINGIHNAGGMACETEQLAAQLNLEPRGGGFRLKMSAAKIFGLITYERGGRISLTELGRLAIDPHNEASAKVKAFLSVELYKKVYEEYKGRPLPPRPALERVLVEYGVAEKLKERARQILDRSAKQAGFFNMQPDRLVMPRIDNLTETEAEKESKVTDDIEKQKYSSGGNGGGMHPAFQLLLQTLPEPGTAWDSKQRMNWLIMANSAFNMIYKANDGEEIDISIKQK